MIKYCNTGSLCLSDGTKIPSAMFNRRKAFYTHHIIFALHHDYVPKRIGRVDGNPMNDKIENLYDMEFGPPVNSVYPVAKCKLWMIYERFPDITDHERNALWRPIPEDVLNEFLGFFRNGETFVPMGDQVVDRRTGGVFLRRIIAESLVATDRLCYDGVCYRST